MKTGQMLFVAFGGMLLGAAGTLAVQTGLIHYEISLDIRPRGAATTVPPPALSSTASDPYLASPVVQNWEPVPSAEQQVPVSLPPLDDQQIAEIVALRQQIRGSSDNGAFAEHLRAAAGLNCLPLPSDSTCPECCEEPSPLASGLHQPVQR
jgi:hypothetical protein